MKQKAAQSAGFGLVIVIVMACFMSILIGVAVRNTMFFHDIVLLSQEHTQQQAASEGLLRYGIALALNRYDYFYRTQVQPYELIVGAWPSEDDYQYEGKLCITKEQSGLCVHAYLMTDGEIEHTATCMVQKTNNGIEIKNWAVMGKKMA